jgi:hypothetical protein
MINFAGLVTASRIKKQYFDILCASNFLPRGFADSANLSEGTFVDTSPFSEFSTNVPLVKAVIASGFFPRVAIYRGKKLLRTKMDHQVSPMSSSIASLVQEDEVSNPFFVYDEMIRTHEKAGNKASISNLSSVPLWGLILFGSNMKVAYRDDLSICILDDWIIFRCPYKVQETIRKMRYAFHKCLAKKFSDPHNEENNIVLTEIADVVRSLLAAPIRPNDVITNDWEEKGTIVPADTATVAAAAATAGGEPTIGADGEDAQKNSQAATVVGKDDQLSAEDLNLTAASLL